MQERDANYFSILIRIGILIRFDSRLTSSGFYHPLSASRGRRYPLETGDDCSRIADYIVRTARKRVLPSATRS